MKVPFFSFHFFPFLFERKDLSKKKKGQAMAWGLNAAKPLPKRPPCNSHGHTKDYVECLRILRGERLPEAMLRATSFSDFFQRGNLWYNCVQLTTSFGLLKFSAFCCFTAFLLSCFLYASLRLRAYLLFSLFLAFLNVLQFSLSSSFSLSLSLCLLLIPRFLQASEINSKLQLFAPSRFKLH